MYLLMHHLCTPSLSYFVAEATFPVSSINKEDNVIYHICSLQTHFDISPDI